LLKNGVWTELIFDFKIHSGNGNPITVNYGYNERDYKALQEKYGVDILKAEAEPLKIMEIRGEYFLSFL